MLCQLKKPFFIDLEPFFDYLHEQIKIIGRRFGGGGGVAVLGLGGLKYKRVEKGSLNKIGTRLLKKTNQGVAQSLFNSRGGPYTNTV